MKADIEQADEFYAERMAIIEFDGCMPRHEAEHWASVATYRWCWRTGHPWPKDPSFRVRAGYFANGEIDVLG
ncbi:hypothetical protein [Robbsia andropogonis]|uniref:hypothetical protein n=1 Tax=Robbsia andropogonis TaxID=28092 RepID=UPI002A6B43FF|nr:hypothetical protein [Robbsia andropogonis]